LSPSTLSIRASNATTPNTRLTEMPARTGEGNGSWLHRTGAPEGIVLFGGTSPSDLRLRGAQAPLRNDVTPSHWSLAGILVGPAAFLSVPLDLAGDVSTIPASNGIRECAIADYDDPGRYPNVAHLSFAAEGAAIRDAAIEVRRQRSLLDVPALIVAWLAHVWGVDDCNPLAAGHGMPSAAFVEAAHSAANIELTPGLASASSCPEAIWQTAKWWGEYYVDTARLAAAAGPRSPGHAIAAVPSGRYLIRRGVASPDVAPVRAGRSQVKAR
jgi:hypothetical protein